MVILRKPRNKYKQLANTHQGKLKKEIKPQQQKPWGGTLLKKKCNSLKNKKMHGTVVKKLNSIINQKLLTKMNKKLTQTVLN